MLAAASAFWTELPRTTSASGKRLLDRGRPLLGRARPRQERDVSLDDDLSALLARRSLGGILAVGLACGRHEHWDGELELAQRLAISPRAGEPDGKHAPRQRCIHVLVAETRPAACQEPLGRGEAGLKVVGVVKRCDLIDVEGQALFARRGPASDRFLKLGVDVGRLRPSPSEVQDRGKLVQGSGHVVGVLGNAEGAQNTEVGSSEPLGLHETPLLDQEIGQMANVVRGSKVILARCPKSAQQCASYVGFAFRRASLAGFHEALERNRTIDQLLQRVRCWGQGFVGMHKSQRFATEAFSLSIRGFGFTKLAACFK